MGNCTYQSPDYFGRWFALLGYVVLATLIYIALRRFHAWQMRKQKLELLHKQKESLRLQQDKHKERLRQAEDARLETERILLEEKVKDKTLALAKSSKEIKDKNRVLHYIRKKLDEIEKNPTATKSKLKTAEIRRYLDDYFDHDDQIFEIQIDELHQDFILKLKDKYPDLTTYDLRLATYLKMGMKTKEIADIVEVLPSSINVSRSRLRKKLGLKTNENLYIFFNNI